MKRFLIMLLVLLLAAEWGGVYAQMQPQGMIDSLLKELPKADDDSNKNKIAVNIGNKLQCH